MKLYPYQRIGVKQIWKFRGRTLLADEMGLGKTVQALEYLRLSPKKRPAVIVCPASVKWIWDHHISEILNIQATIATGRTPPKKGIKNTPQIIVINYDILANWLDYLKGIKPKILICDEAHFLKSPRAQRTRATKALAKQCKFMIGLTGTPLTNKPSELWSCLNMIRPDLYPALWSFRWRYCDPKKKPWGWEFNGATHLDELHTNLKKTMMIRRLKKNVLKDLPDKTRIVVPLEMENPKEYRKAATDFIKWLTSKSESKAAKAKSAEKITQISYLRQLAAELKMKAVKNWIDNFFEENTGKLAIYAHHKAIIQSLHKTYPNSVTIDGGTPQKQRKEHVRAFQNNDKIKLFIGNIKAAGTGITLTAASSLAFAELSFVPGDMIQAEDRIHRIGQKEGAMIYYLVAKNSIEEKLCAILQQKQKIISSVLDGGPKQDDLKIFDELENELRKGS